MEDLNSFTDFFFLIFDHLRNCERSPGRNGPRRSMTLDLFSDVHALSCGDC